MDADYENYRNEMDAQRQALSMMYGDELDLIARFAPEMRVIIVEFEATQGRVPTADELVHILSEHHEKNLREL